MIWATVFAMIHEKTLNVSQKVAVPMFLGLATAGLVCVAGQHGYKLDAGTAVWFVVMIMSSAGWIVSANNPAAASLIKTAANGGKEDAV